MPNWKKYKLEDIASKLGDGLHGTPKYDNNGEFIFVNGSNLVDGIIVITSNTKRVNSTEFNKHKKELNESTILLGINGTIGNVALYSNEKCILGKSACYINVREDFDRSFIKYVLLNNHFQNYIKTNATGSTIKNVGLKTLREYEVLIPSSIETQRRIAEILSALDDKIELNRRMNQTLEQMAQTLFRQYFVDGIDEENMPEGWREGKLHEVIELPYGKALKQGDRKGGEYPVVGSSGIVGFHDSYIAEGKGIVVGRKGNAGAVIWLDQKFYPIDTTYYVVDQLEVEDLYFHYFLLKSLPLAGMNSDSAVPGLNRNDAYNIDILIPNCASIIDFNNKVRLLFDQKYTKEKEINTLTQLRDTLLPKLMSGEIDVMQTKPDELHEPVLS